MFFVYSIQSISNPDRYYIGMTNDIGRRLAEHNNGKSVHTEKYIPWEIVFYAAFPDKKKATKFELYLKTGSGRSFLKKHL